MLRRYVIPRLARLYTTVAPSERGGYRLSRLARRAWPRDAWEGRFRTPHGLELGLDLETYPDVAMAFGVYELDTLRLLRKLLKPGNTFVDGGANLGYFTLHAAALGARIEAFEPDPQNRVRLEANLAANPSDWAGRVHVHPIALSDTAGRATLHHPATTDHLNHGSTSLLPGLAGGGTQTAVETARLDGVLSRADVVKLDVEGAELAALRGMASLLGGDHAPAVIVEVNHAACKAAGHRPGALHDTMQVANPRYRCWWIGRRLRPLPDAEALNHLPRQGNVLFRCGT